MLAEYEIFVGRMNALIECVNPDAGEPKPEAVCAANRCVLPDDPLVQPKGSSS